MLGRAWEATAWKVRASTTEGHHTNVSFPLKHWQTLLTLKK